MGLRKKQQWRSIASVALSSLSCLSVIAIWFAIAHFQVVSSLKIPSPSMVLHSARTLAAGGFFQSKLWNDIWDTWKAVIFGYVLGSAFGYGLGLWLGISRRARLLVNSPIQALRSIPPIAWIPMVILWIGLGLKAETAIVAYAAFGPILVNVESGIANIPREYIEASLTLGAGRLRRFWTVMIRSIEPEAITGLKVAVQTSWMAVVAAELIGAVSGLGAQLELSTETLDSGSIALMMLLIGASGAVSSVVIGLLGKHAKGWQV